jgi:hypothetical protein
MADQFRPAARLFGVLSVAVLVTVTVGCGESDDTAGPSDTAASSSLVGASEVDDAPLATDTPPATEAPPASDAADPGSALDACSLLTDAEIAVHLPGATTGTGNGGTVCEWLDPTTEESITLSIGDAGTAASGRLPEPSDYGDTEPIASMGDAARYVPGFGIVEFVAEDRSCEIQVAVLGDQRGPAVELATLASSRISTGG